MREIGAKLDIVAGVAAHLADELRRDIPVATRIKIFWGLAEALQHTAPHQQIKQTFIIIAEQTGLITDLGHHGDEDVRHVVDWALRGRVPFEFRKNHKAKAVTADIFPEPVQRVLERGRHNLKLVLPQDGGPSDGSTRPEINRSQSDLPDTSGVIPLKEGDEPLWNTGRSPPSNCKQWNSDQSHS